MVDKSGRKRSGEIRRFLLDHIEECGASITRTASQKFRVSRQTINRHLDTLEKRSLIQSTGSRRKKRYTLAPVTDESFGLIVSGGWIAEDEVWLEKVRPHLEGVPKNVLDICAFGFTEMLNNIIEHSDARVATFRVKRTANTVELGLRDDGVGIFKKIQSALKLEHARHAVLELVKGKCTTSPATHTGQGIFFTSRMFDRFSILSGQHIFLHDAGTNGDWIIEDQDFAVIGTLVEMRISTHSTRTARQIFSHYEHPKTWSFDRTEIPVILGIHGDEGLISRSQAKRLLARTDRFAIVYLDFRGVESIGPAFADEVFRVFAKAYPGMSIRHVNANARILKMIRRAELYKQGSARTEQRKEV